MGFFPVFDVHLRDEKSGGEVRESRKSRPSATGSMRRSKIAEKEKNVVRGGREVAATRAVLTNQQKQEWQQEQQEQQEQDGRRMQRAGFLQ